MSKSRGTRSNQSEADALLAEIVDLEKTFKTDKLTVVVDEQTKNLIQDVTRLAARITGSRRLQEGLILKIASLRTLKEMLAYLKASEDHSDDPVSA